MKSAPLPPLLKPEPMSLAGYQAAVLSTWQALDWGQVGLCLDRLRALKVRAGRLFILGVGGSAANASHAVNDFRKVAGVEAYAATDNVAELTARINDDSWGACFRDWLKVSHCGARDLVLTLSVGGGHADVSANIYEAVSYAAQVSAVIGIVGPHGGATAHCATACVKIPAEPPYITPLVESFQPLIWHYWVNAL